MPLGGGLHPPYGIVQRSRYGEEGAFVGRVQPANTGGSVTSRVHAVSAAFHPPYGPDREPDTDREGPLVYKLKATDHH